MHSNISSPLELSHSGTTIAAHGPILDWEDDEVSAAITITIAQNGVSATKTQTYAKPASSWQMTLVASDDAEFDDGSADGTGDAVVNLSGGGTEPYHWTRKIDLDD